uniref:Protein kinase domain-containing protein n=1 Tax=Ananas comosus var. bracteatus TaxID=296719 RepID=A0A6V7NH80_ANACO|nr:unnamed protein product [Ananas comosus var. bracteatus]
MAPQGGVEAEAEEDEEEEGEGEHRERNGDEEEEEEEAAAKKTMVVGIKMDSQSREILTWALVKLASPGDRVVAIHILPSSSSYSSSSSSSSSPVDLDAMIAVYEGFCNLKQIDLKLKICRGSSIRKLLVREATALNASAVILGAADKNRAFGSSSISVAKYCAKKLPTKCSVIAVNSGKVVFQREAIDDKCNSSKTGSRSFSTSFISKLRSSKDPAADLPSCWTMISELPSCQNGELYPIEDREENDHDSSIEAKDVDGNCNDSTPSTELEIGKNDEVHSAIDAPPKENCSVCNLRLDPPCANASTREEERLGWPVVRKKIVTHKRSASFDWPKISVVQWAMRRSNRNAAIHPDSKSLKSSSNTKTNSDSDSGSNFMLYTDSIQDFAFYDEEGWPPKELDSLREKYSSVCRLFRYEELKLATSNFSPENLIGKGGNSRVYKARLSDGDELAVKILKPSDAALKEFVSEIEIITTLHHKNIITLLGFCFENNSLILVYNYLPRGSLEEILHGDQEIKYVVCWAERYKVAIGVAEALDYLHGIAQPVIHRDVKSSNILLSNDFEPQLSDFGFAKWVSSPTSHLTCTDVAGTFGYLAPEYFMYGKVNEKIDVYAFGVVLLELISGKKPIRTGCPKGQESLVMWAKPILRGGEIKELVDPSLGNEYDSDQMERMALAASLCIRAASRLRPRIAPVLKLLQGDDSEVFNWARSEVSSSEGLNDAEDEESNAENIRSHLNLAMLDIEDDSLSVSSTEQTVDSMSMSTSMEDYWKERWSQSISFD